jgi:hypothetical protein
MILMISASQVARITGMNHHTWLRIFDYQITDISSKEESSQRISDHFFIELSPL